MKQQNPIFILAILLCFFLIAKYRYTTLESFIDVDREHYTNDSSCRVEKKLCNNFESECVGTGNNTCNNPSIVACQKYRLKCETTCKHKKIDDNGKKQNNYDKCIQTCQTVQSDCCDRLENL